MIPAQLIRYHLWRHWPWARWCAAALTVCLALWLHSNTDPAAQIASVSVVTAATSLPAGHALTVDDLTSAPHSWGFPAQRSPELLGRLLREPIDAAEPLSAARLVPDRDLLRRAEMIMVPLKIADPATGALLTAGDRVDVYTSEWEEQTQPRLVGEDLEVLAVSTVASDASLSAPPATALLAVPEQSAIRLAGLGDRSTTVFLR